MNGKPGEVSGSMDRFRGYLSRRPGRVDLGDVRLVNICPSCYHRAGSPTIGTLRGLIGGLVSSLGQSRETVYMEHVSACQPANSLTVGEHLGTNGTSVFISLVVDNRTGSSVSCLSRVATCEGWQRIGRGACCLSRSGAASGRLGPSFGLSRSGEVDGFRDQV